MSDVEELFTFIKQCPSPYHTVKTVSQLLEAHDFTPLSMEEEWHLEPGAYYVSVYGTTIFAFLIGQDIRHSMRIVSAHTDFPALRVKPNPLVREKKYGKINIETYGGLLLEPWLDRPLSMAGLVVTKGADAFTPKTHLVNICRPICTIPHLAIHMNRKANEGVALNRQIDMLPLGMMWPEEETDDSWLAWLADEINVKKEDILSYELTLYPVEDGMVFGLYDEFVSSPRLDNLTSCYAALQGLLTAAEKDTKGLRIMALFDNEEVGSRTKQGGASQLLPNILERLYMATGHSKEECLADTAAGFMVSADVAHAYHPNHGEKNDLTNIPVLNGGVALKEAASQSYAGDAQAIATIKQLCKDNKIPYQIYVNRSDIPGGSTIGSITSALLTMRTMDVGIPILAMHSVRETMGIEDQDSLTALLTAVLL